MRRSYSIGFTGLVSILCSLVGMQRTYPPTAQATARFDGAQRLQQAFVSGNLVVVRVGDGSATVTSGATATFLDEYTQTGTLVQSLALPIASNGSQAALTLAGSSTSEGALTRSVDGRYVTIVGYNAIPGTASVAATTSATINRVVARVAADGTIDTSTRINDAFSGTNPRSAVTDDGSRFWVGGANSGVRFVLFGNTGASTQLANDLTNTRVLRIFKGQLYVSAQSGTNTYRGISTVGTGLPTTSGQTTTRLPGLTDSLTNNSYGYALLDRDATIVGLDTLYIADQTSGVQKFSFDGTTWTARGAISGIMTGLVAIQNGQNVDIYATRGTGIGTYTLIKITDTAAFNSTLTGAITVLASSATNTVFRGVALAPQTPTLVTLVSFTAHAENADVAVEWQTGSEYHTAGFRVFRATDGLRAHAVEVTTALIPSEGDGVSGAAYRWLDTTVEAGRTYTYWLQEVETSGKQIDYDQMAQVTLPASASSV